MGVLAPSSKMRLGEKEALYYNIPAHATPPQEQKFRTGGPQLTREGWWSPVWMVGL